MQNCLCIYLKRKYINKYRGYLVLNSDKHVGVCPYKINFWKYILSNDELSIFNAKL